METNNTTMVKEKVFSIKLLIDTKAKRVLFAEAGKEFIDFLFGLLTLPLGSVVKLVTKKSMVGSLGNLYESVENISAAYIQPNLDKNLLLKPKSMLSCGNIPLLPPSVPATAENYFTCNHCYNHHITNTPGTACPSCNFKMDSKAYFVAGTKIVASTDGGGYVKGIMTYMVSDELVIMPMSTISSITLLKKFNVGDINSLEEKSVDFGMEEALELLKSALQSKSVLTDVFLQKKVKPEPL
ncbi:hypothetical protein IFM89_002052 [Coptis chinensis]|uniref:DUF674 domain-containing protein n=1 Tax=Coptis chinensis TaxID=261450 RepID=A0A835H8K6_9MAGN|nr:hypothetical protein IFM89_002052 [Coptis chinensis]